MQKLWQTLAATKNRRRIGPAAANCIEKRQR
jgi:hypothetical protein